MLPESAGSAATAAETRPSNASKVMLDSLNVKQFCEALVVQVPVFPDAEGLGEGDGEGEGDREADVTHVEHGGMEDQAGILQQGVEVTPVLGDVGQAHERA